MAVNADAPVAIAAIGDIHGEAELLRTTLEGLADLERRNGVSPIIYFLGDIVDRGPDSCGALDLVIETIASRRGSRLLLGNHDDWLMQFLINDLPDDEIANWLDQGGAETLYSYGLRARALPDDARNAILAAHPAHLPLLRSASILEQAGRFAFAHAGVDPARRFDQQDREDCIWIRGPFHRHVGLLEKIVVHGHQPQKGGLPVVTENRISMDTGAVFTGRLSTVLIEPDSGVLKFYQALAGDGFKEIAAQPLDRGLGTAMDFATAGNAHLSANR